MIEADALADRTLFYLFRGELGRAALGIADLRRITREQGGAKLRFEFATSHYGFSAPDWGGAGAGGAAGSAAGASSLPEPALSLSVDEQRVELFAVDAATAFELGVTRFLRATDSLDYAVSVFWGARPSSADFEWIEVPSDSGPLRHRTEVRAVEVTVESDESDNLVVLHDELRGADYKLIDLLQQTTRTSDHALVNAVARTSYPPSTKYRASPSLRAVAQPGLCWSLERPLFARVTQVARRYQTRKDEDFAVIHQRRDFAEVPLALWEVGVEDAEPASYCDKYD
jgi:hypothetical protein